MSTNCDTSGYLRNAGTTYQNVKCRNSNNSTNTVLNTWDLRHPNLIVTTVLGAFAKLRKVTSFVMSFCLSVRLSVRMEQLGFQSADFEETWYLRFFLEKLSRKLKFR